MGPFDIVVVVLVGAAFLAVVGTAIYKKVKHKGSGCSGCGCGCEGCSLHCNCHHTDPKKK